jgi:predicted nucleic acid-binding protein
MSGGDRFFDTNVLLYLLSADSRKADRAESELSGGGVISVQVLNEFAAVALRKLGMPIAEIRDVLATIRAVCRVVSLVEATHDLGLEIADRHGLTLYDSVSIASAMLAGCATLVSQNMQDGQVFEGRLEIRNPFR